MDLNGKLSLVTGASRGIGNAIALELLKKNSIVIGTATSDIGVQKILKSGIHGINLNINDLDNCNQVMDQIKNKYGDIDILINNASIVSDSISLKMSYEKWFNVLNTNLSSTFFLSKKILNGMIKKKWGRIINISSVVACTGNIGQSNYSASKAGLIAMSKSLAREVGSRNITVNCVAPGLIDTDMTKILTIQQKKLLLDQIPLKRFGLPIEVAKAVAFLATEDASYITGNTLHINGGMYMY